MTGTAPVAGAAPSCGVSPTSNVSRAALGADRAQASGAVELPLLLRHRAAALARRYRDRLIIACLKSANLSLETRRGLICVMPLCRVGARLRGCCVSRIV